MGGLVKFKLDEKGVAELLTSPEARSVVAGAAENLRARAGEGFKVHSSTAGNRARAYVHAGTREAGIRQARKHVLERVYGSMVGD